MQLVIVHFLQLLWFGVVPALPCPALPCPALPCSALPCSALPCPALPCPALIPNLVLTLLNLVLI